MKPAMFAHEPGQKMNQVEEALHTRSGYTFTI